MTDQPALLHSKRVLFVGAFKQAGADGTVGGVTYACTTLLAHPKSAAFDWLLIDTTAPTNKPRSLFSRNLQAARRMLHFGWKLTTRRVDTVAIFIGHGGSFIEKGLMTILAARFAKHVVLAPMSGFIKTDLQNSTRRAAFARRVFRHCDVIICQSDSWRRFYADYCSDIGKLHVVENWLDARRYPVGTATQKSPQITILFLAWVVREKGIFELIDALVDLARRGVTNYRVLICGDGGDLPAARQRVQEQQLDNVEFLGWTTGQSKAELLLSSHIFILPSYAEGLSNSLLEAMASGLAVISTDVGAARDVIEDGVNGLLIQSHSASQISTALQRLLDSPNERARIGIAAHQRVEHHNSIDSGVSAFLGLL